MITTKDSESNYINISILELVHIYANINPSAVIFSAS